MGFINKLLLIGTALSAVWIGKLFFRNPPIPVIKDQWWGEGNPVYKNEAIRPFKIEISDEVCSISLCHTVANQSVNIFLICRFFLTLVRD